MNAKRVYDRVRSEEQPARQEPSTVKRIDPAIYETTGREYTATDADGNEHIVVKSAEHVHTRWNTYFVHANGRIESSSHENLTLAAARTHVAKIGGYTA